MLAKEGKWKWNSLKQEKQIDIFKIEIALTLFYPEGGGIYLTNLGVSGRS